MAAAIEIYTRPGCGYCTAAKSLLTRKNAAFTELNVAVSGVAELMFCVVGADEGEPNLDLQRPTALDEIDDR